MSAVLVQKCSPHTKQSPKSKKKAKEISHLYMNGKNLQNININAKYDNLKVLYLHNNQIQIISNLENFSNLSHLYLQWNKIRKIENLNCLRSLQKLYLGYNRIIRLENIERLYNLKELHIEKQEIDDGEEFLFDYFTLKSVARSVEVLNISNLGLVSMEPISVLFKLKHLIADGNRFQDAKEIGHVLGQMLLIEKADIQDCPAQKDTHYREKITAGSYNLQYLNGKFITPYNRVFIKRLEAIKSEHRTKSETNTKFNYQTKNNEKKSFHSLQLQSSLDELSFRAWNSLNSAQKPKRLVNKVQSGSRPKSDYPLEGKHIVNE